MDFKKIISEKHKIQPWLHWLFIAAIFISIAYYTNLRTANVYDPDSFYHIRHAKVLLDAGITSTDFPWTYYSIIRTTGADLWYGFHIFLIPFTYITYAGNLAWAIKIAGLFITFFVLTACYLAFKNLKFKLPALLSMALLLSNGAMLYRMSMTRPHPISLGLVAIIFSFFNTGPFWPILISSFLLSWLHSSFFWFPIVIAAPIILFKWLNKEKVGTLKIISLLAGLIGGLALRPHPVENLRLIYTQIVDVFFLKGYELAALIGTELRMTAVTNWGGLLRFLWPILFLITISLLILAQAIRKKWDFPKETKIIAISSFVMLLFSLNMYITSNRAIDLLTLFSFIFAGSVISYYLSEKEKETDPKLLLESKIMFLCALIPFLTFISYGSIPRFERALISTTMAPNRFKEPALWLKENTDKGEIVFHLFFDQFPSLFFWNQNNYYIYGMDPVFLYKYDPKLYWEMYYLAVNDTGNETCNSENCESDENIVSTYDVITKDFKASYVFVDPRIHKNFLSYLRWDKKHFQEVFSHEQGIIFKVLPENSKPFKN